MTANASMHCGFEKCMPGLPSGVMSVLHVHLHVLTGLHSMSACQLPVPPWQFCMCSGPWLEPYVFVRERDVMDPQVVQAFAALLAGAGATQQPQPSWLQQLAAAAAAGTQTSSASSASSFGYPGTGLFASQSATDAAQMYGYMMQLAEQAKLVASAEAQSASPVPSPRSEEELRNKVREVLRSELAPGNVKAPPLKQTQDPKASDPQDAPAEADPEQALDQARREYEAERQKEGHEVDKKAIRFAKDFYDRDPDMRMPRRQLLSPVLSALWVVIACQVESWKYLPGSSRRRLRRSRNRTSPTSPLPSRL